ncbi:MAG: hypothetical protein KZQ94_21970 [Candidatus Thiodiazotropha sp. (ex Troendleina suluensis)]|nr:hypothetical protein [Candidatus Thiodiazotropha sp. (ex Troendleina suluensis)]
MKCSLVYIPMLGAAFLLSACAFNKPKVPDTGTDTNTGVEINSQKAETDKITKTLHTDKAITWEKSGTGVEKGEVKPNTSLPSKPNLSGFWVLNRELSDDAQNIIKESMQQARSSGKGGFEPSRRGGGIKGGGHRNGTRGSHSSADRVRKSGGQEKALRELHVLFSKSENLLLTHDDPNLLIVTDDGWQQRIFTDNRGTSISASGGINQKVTTAGWEQNILVVETTSDSGPQLIQQYTMNIDPHQLIISTDIQLSELSNMISIKRIYESVPLSKHTINPATY